MEDRRGTLSWWSTSVFLLGVGHGAAPLSSPLLYLLTFVGQTAAMWFWVRAMQDAGISFPSYVVRLFVCLLSASIVGNLCEHWAGWCS